MSVKIYHNPRCSKSRATLTLLQDRQAAPEVIEYLKTPPTAEELADLLVKLGIPARELVRSREAEFVASGLTLDSPEAELVALMATHPILIERPIVVVGNHARIGRPPEQVLDLFQ